MEFKPLEFVSIGLTVVSLIGAIVQYNKDVPKVGASPLLLRTDTLPNYNLKMYAQPANIQFQEPATIRIYMERNMRELPVKFVRGYSFLMFANIKDSVLTLGARKLDEMHKVDTFSVILPDTFPKKVTLDMMHKFEQIRREGE
jgi:hypothetical protein